MTSALALRVEAGAGAAPFEQIREQITALIAAGELPVGTRLPPVRALAETLGVAAGTVARSYRELESAGLVETRGRAGTVVAGGVDALERELQAAAAVFASRARELGATADGALTAASRALGV
ncbi:GntR family transcriptional regulator [Rathayibacter sp. VKM Ac-2762]|uniref:GntR family transcriptional regulator n=1 Tax=Rathayibacter sp. VKM Ac-2762 TaxID=2609254 RepID=UPI00132F3E61|nr:GntR family transcriptional regulator [Rathayibacter sp. VKM Ac-2762]QHF19949.1 GntR family transcriptional regulator [Rathayibacter sp. VKM Ac-2762]